VKRFLTYARRALSVALATGAALFALATPAQAHAFGDDDTPHLTITHSTVCLPDGQRQVTWTVATERDDDGTISAVTLGSTPVAAGFVNGNIIKVGETLPGDGGSLSDKQVMPGTNTSASLAVSAKFGSGEFIETISGSDAFEFTPCIPLYTVSQDCNGFTFVFKGLPAGEAIITRHVTLHPSVGADQSFDMKSGDPDKTVTIAGAPGLTVELSYGDGFKASYAFTHDPCPTLPKTGSNLGGTIGAGIGLVVVGTALLVLVVAMRRRRSATQA
jgi:hypothetical protein